VALFRMEEVTMNARFRVLFVGLKEIILFHQARIFRKVFQIIGRDIFD